ncbi:16S rRNA (guanine(966)-N(2))-methyltransferase RsmD [Kushneria phosphatilytica]|uniref:Ribosomal RNA small subunit methyltransferase D n=1 Tax=Kushneria phosphatilytica TaxID=657387 RepID=A0A1S1NVY7_9GAMM|nr:16S rRNA (guanine(966)-N(2))-methyltransferase RsmD [Kushneria phosphatilytica]OHV10901.1 16S rRNA (guanine(966)-N(2))-methyltransferase RsmD [Kushneria phosphatilytica]QEL12013.1 16S rRNA (guanine(966)-N(2))-methyltransferase RsmD [Kushneria phosphatilytica]
MARRTSRRPASKSADRGRGTLRLIGGDFRRRRLPIPDRPGLRPTPDRVRETLFNWLMPLPGTARVLDLYAGTGALGLEALSRGAGTACFVEHDPAAAEQLRTNLATLFNSPLPDGRPVPTHQVIEEQVSAFLARSPEAPFNLVLLDPPFRQALVEKESHRLETGGWLAQDARIYIETEPDAEPILPTNWQLYRQTRAGDSLARLYIRH